MVETLIDEGATFSFTLTPALKRKYDCRISINNFDDIPINFALYLFPKYDVNGYPHSIIDDPERIKTLRILYEKNIGDFSELLYYAILFQDDTIFNELKRLGITKLSEYRTDIVAGTIPTNRLNAFASHDKNQFQWYIKNSDDEELKIMLDRFLSCMDVDTITLAPSDFFIPKWYNHTSNDVFISRFCSETLFDFFIQKTNMIKKVKKWDLLLGIVEQNNASALQYALNKKWLSKPRDIDTLLTHIQEQKHLKPELVGYVLDLQHRLNNGTNEKSSIEESFSLDPKPLSVSELKKIWGTKQLDDGSLMITSYKGDERDVIIPSIFGKKVVTAIDSETFNPKAPRLSSIQQKKRQEITSVTFPGTIREIPSNIFTDRFNQKSRHPALNRIVLCDGIVKICSDAFYGCNEVEEIILPNSIQEIGSWAFAYCSNLKSITLPQHITVLPYGVFMYSGLESFIVDNRFTTIEASIFEGCNELESVKLPDSMTEIPANMFCGCESLQSFEFPSNITYIGEYAFARCGFNHCEIPDQVKIIETKAFLDCKSLASVILPKDITIGDSAFTGCDALADDDGKIVVNGVLHGVTESTSSKAHLNSLILNDNITAVSVSITELPEIVCREFTGDGKTVDINSLIVGEEVIFGRFPMDDDYIMHPLKWKVLAKENESALLMTVNEIIGLYSDNIQRGVWADSNVRKMLNSSFLDVAFTEQERIQISKVTIHTDKNKSCGSNGGPDTEDFVFLLSLEEVETYLSTEESRKSTATPYAQKQVPTGNHYYHGYWKLRTPGKGYFGSVAVSDDSGHYSAMTGNHSGSSFVRPAIWIKNV